MSDEPTDRPRALSPQELCRRCDPSRFAFGTTAELEDVTEALGQSRAVDAIRFGVGIDRQGYNLFVMGPEGVGRHTVVRRLLEEHAAQQPVPADWCYVFNFALPHRPNAVKFAAGQARKFARHMDRLVEDLRAGIPAAFETDEYRARMHEIEAEFGDHQERAFGGVREHARPQGIALLRTPAGFGFAPLKNGAVMDPEDYQKLPEEEQKRLQDAIAVLQEELEKVVHELPKFRREAQHKLRELNREVTRLAVASLIEELLHAYRDNEEVRQYLSDVQEDVLDHAEYFQQAKEGEQPALFGMPLPQREAGESFLRRYRVNVLVDHDDHAGAPVVYEDYPTHDNLVGRVEHQSQMGALVTDFTLIKAGAFHRANGGYLVLDVLKVLLQPLAWDALKRGLQAREARIESLGQALSLVSTVSLDPEPIPLDLKVVLVGQRTLYYMLHALDPEFGELFKVQADFEEDMERGDDADLMFARLLAMLARRERLAPLDRSAVARFVEHASRTAGDSGKLGVHVQSLVDLLLEADYWAGAAARAAVPQAPATAASPPAASSAGGSTTDAPPPAAAKAAVIAAEHVQRALDEKENRASRVRRRLQEQVQLGTVLVDTAGERAGQVNGLAVMQLGGFSFGMPHRITARVRLGGGGVVDIEREAQLGGPIHSKGVLILSGFLAGRYAVDRPLSLSASLVFEQSYGGVEGDSASSAELYALLSALAEAPIRQSFAVTGSVNQHGDIQAIGGVNEKIEGFFDICAARGLTGEQGVLVPASNVRHITLRKDVVDAVAAGKFRVYSVHTVDQGIELLTGVAAGRRDGSGQFPEGSLNRRVEQRLLGFADRARAHAGAAPRRKTWRAKPEKAAGRS